MWYAFNMGRDTCSELVGSGLRDNTEVNYDFTAKCTYIILTELTVDSY